MILIIDKEKTYCLLHSDICYMYKSKEYTGEIQSYLKTHKNETLIISCLHSGSKSIFI